MLALDLVKHIRRDPLLTVAFEQMDRDGVSHLPVFKDDQLASVLTWEDLISHLRTLQGVAK